MASLWTSRTSGRLCPTLPQSLLSLSSLLRLPSLPAPCHWGWTLSLTIPVLKPYDSSACDHVWRRGLYRGD